MAKSLNDDLKKKAVVTGGAGFIGSHVVDALVEAGYDVHVIDNLIEGKKEFVNEKAALHICDVRDLPALLPIMKDATYVFHLAALPRVQYSIDFPVESHDVNVTGTLNVLYAAKKAGVKRVIFSASSATYGNQPISPLHEDLPVMPLSPYGLHKYIGEQYVRLFSEIYGLSAVSLRYFNVYGPREDPDGPYALVIPMFLKFRKEGKPLTVTGDGEQTRDFTHVRDVARANVLAAEGANVGRGEVINIGGGHNCSINYVAKLIGGPVVYVPKHLEPHDTLADITRAKKLLDWEPTVSVEDGVAELLREWKI